MIDERALLGGNYAAELQPGEAYRARRKIVQERLGDDDIAVVFGARDDRGYGDVGTFRQRPSFFYLTGVELPNAVVMLEKEHEVLFVPARRPSLEVWTGPKLGPGAEAERLLGFAEVADREPSEVVVKARRRLVPGFVERAASRVAAGGALWIEVPGAAYAGPSTEGQALVRSLRDLLPSFPVRDLGRELAALRVVKHGSELALMRKAVASTCSAMRAAALALGPGVSEGHVEGAAFAAIRSFGAEGWSFPPIVGSGVAGCVLHYDANRGSLASGELVVVDIGARYGYYCGDLTRTFPVDGTFTARQRSLYEAVLAAYDAAVNELRPGALIADAREAAYEALARSGLRGDDGFPIADFFIHGVGHFLGLEAHDVGGEEQRLGPGMVVTVEPGVYLPKEGVGVRVEDDYLITAGGAENLSAELAREADAVEEMAGAKL